MSIKISLEEYEELIDEYVGICLACGAHRDSCEPDARQYECEECGENKVYGIEELLIMGRVE